MPLRSLCTYAPHSLQALEAADYIVEAVPEREELKAELFRKLESLTQPHAVLASNTRCALRCMHRAAKVGLWPARRACRAARHAHHAAFHAVHPCQR